MNSYDDLCKHLIRGWNTWYVRSMMTHVLMPEALAVTLGIKSRARGQYPMLADAATSAQAERMVREHFYNPAEFWGEWILPSIARNDPAYPEQDYWRGRVWGPMNLLVYISLRRAGMTQACRDLVAKSTALPLKGWLAHGHVCENYNAETGDTTVAPGKKGGTSFYYWGGLLGTIALMEAGFYPDPSAPPRDTRPQ